MEPLLDPDSHVTLASAFPLWALVSLSGAWVQRSGELTLLTKAVAAHPNPQEDPGSPAPSNHHPPKTSCQSSGIKFYSAVIVLFFF